MPFQTHNRLKQTVSLILPAHCFCCCDLMECSQTVQYMMSATEHCQHDACKQKKTTLKEKMQKPRDRRKWVLSIGREEIDAKQLKTGKLIGESP